MKQVLKLSVLIAVLSLAGCSYFRGAGNTADGNSNSQLHAADITDANAALEEGTKLLDAGETERAIEVLLRAVEINPDLGDAFFRLGIAYSLIEFRDQLAAEESVEQPVEPSPDGRPANAKKKNSEVAFAKAVDAYRKQIDLNEEDHAAYFNLGRSYNKLNKDEDAARALRQAVKLKPDDTEYQTVLGSVLIKLARYQEAVGTLKKALEIDPQNIEAEELLEKAEAGRRRVTFVPTPKDSANSNTANTNTAPETEKTPANTATPPAGPPKPPMPSPTRTRQP